MTSVDSQELQINTRTLLDRVEAGEVIRIAVNGRDVAELRPIAREGRWMKRAEFARRVLTHQADAELRPELRRP